MPLAQADTFNAHPLTAYNNNDDDNNNNNNNNNNDNNNNKISITLRGFNYRALLMLQPRRSLLLLLLMLINHTLRIPGIFVKFIQAFLW